MVVMTVVMMVEFMDECMVDIMAEIEVNLLITKKIHVAQRRAVNISQGAGSTPAMGRMQISDVIRSFVNDFQKRLWQTTSSKFLSNLIQTFLYLVRFEK